jgi:agmatine/peptidylarginine deiminase
LREEIEKRLRDFLGVSEILWLGEGTEGDDTDGHIDNLARFVSERTVVAVVEQDRSSANYGPLQENLRRLRELKIANHKIDIIELPTTRRMVREDLVLPASYANFLITTRVLVPTFADPNDEIALSILQNLSLIAASSRSLPRINLGLGVHRPTSSNPPVRGRFHGNRAAERRPLATTNVITRSGA